MEAAFAGALAFAAVLAWDAYRRRLRTTAAVDTEIRALIKRCAEVEARCKVLEIGYGKLPPRIAAVEVFGEQVVDLKKRLDDLDKEQNKLRSVQSRHQAEFGALTGSRRQRRSG